MKCKFFKGEFGCAYPSSCDATAIHKHRERIAELEQQLAELREENERLKDENAGYLAAADSLFADNMALLEEGD